MTLDKADADELHELRQEYDWMRGYIDEAADGGRYYDLDPEFREVASGMRRRMREINARITELTGEE